MKRLVDFWKQDIVNKLIVIVSLLLVGSVFAFIIMLANMPEGKSLRDAISQILPIPSVSSTELSLTATPEWTVTPLAFNISQITITPIPALKLESPTPTLELVTLAPPIDIFTATPTLLGVTPVASTNNSCIPNNPAQHGRVVDVIDGNTIKVLIDGLVYVVRYIGVAAPEDKFAADTARQVNTTFVYGKDITLITDVSDKDDRGRLLRYVLVGDAFINLELITQGLGTVLDVSPDSACVQTFRQAEQSSGSVTASVTASP